MLKKKNSHLFITALLCWSGWVFDFYDLILIAFLIPAIEISLQIDKNIGTWLIGVGLGASGLGGILFGWLADIYGRKKMLTLTVVLFSFGMFLTALTQTPWQFIFARFITGIGLGGEWALGHALIAESASKETRAKWGAFLQSGEPVGVSLAAAVGFLAPPYLGWRGIFIVSSLTGLLALLFRRYLQESPLWLKSRPHSSQEWRNKLLPFLKNYKFLLLIATIFATLKVGTYWCCYTWMPQFINQTYGTAVGKSVLWIICGQLGQLFGIFLYGYCADRIGKHISFSLFSILTALVLFILAIGWSLLFNQFIILFWLLIFLLGIGSGCIPGLGIILAEIFPTAQRTFAMSTVFSIARCAQIFSPVIVGIAVNSQGLFGGLMVPAILALLTAGWVFILPAKNITQLDNVYLVDD